VKHALFAIALLAACGARPPTPIELAYSPEEPGYVRGIAFSVQHRETDGRLAAGLFVRERESPAALRAVAGLVVEARTGVHARATPDGLSLTTSDGTDLHGTIATLARAISVRDATAAEVETALGHLRARRAGRAHDDRGLAQRLAVQALGGIDADSLGSADDDAAITSSAVSTWLATHLGVERSMLVVIGDVSVESACDAVDRGFEHAPHVAELTASTPSWQHGSARVASGDHPIAAAATTARTLDEASRVAAWVPRLVPGASATAFPIRGHAIVVATHVGDEHALEALAASLHHAHRLDEEAPSVVALAADDEVLAVGDGWLADVGETTTDPIGLALVRADDGDAAPHEDASLDALVPDDRAHARGDDDRRGADTLASGVHVRVARTDGDEVAVALSFGVGAAHDPAREHGRTALIAAVVARSCEPDADATWVEADSFGVIVRGDRATLERTVLRAIDCVRRARLEIEHTEGVRAAAVAGLDGRSRMRAWAASVLAPGTPGLVAPLGNAAGLAAATELDDALEDAIDARRITLAIAADAAPSRLLDIADALAASLDAGDARLSDVTLSGPSTTDAFASAIDIDVPLALVALRADGTSSVGARFVAASLARGLAARGLVARDAWGGSAMDTSFAMVLVSGDEDRLDALGTTARSVLASITAPGSLATDQTAAAREHALTLADPAAMARDLATDATTPADPTTVARALLAATPHLVMIRPRAR
jgi:hypothetical protein